MHVSVIGGSGFIGTRLCRRLENDDKIEFSIIDKANSATYPNKVTLADVRAIDSLRETVVESSLIINLAAEHRDDVRPRSLYDEVNVGGARNICKVASEKNIKTIVFTSSVAVYGFAEIGTGESGSIAPVNEYGRTKFEAECIFKAWQTERSDERTLVIIRPTVVFGEQNRGNVYNLLHHIAAGKFVMVGAGNNRKSMAYVENVAAFIRFSMNLLPGVHIYNYVDKPDFTMNELVKKIKNILGKSEMIRIRIPFFIGLVIGKGFDLVATLTKRNFAINSIRIRKFCADSVYSTAADMAGFIAPVSLQDALEKTIKHEFLESHAGDVLFLSE